MSDKPASAANEESAAERFVAAVESMVLRVTVQMPDLSRKIWLTVEEAAVHCGVTPKYIRTKISDGKLALIKERGSELIYRVHLDEQMIRRWPKVDMEMRIKP